MGPVRRSSRLGWPVDLIPFPKTHTVEGDSNSLKLSPTLTQVLGYTSLKIIK